MPIRRARLDEAPLLPEIEHSSDQVYRGTDLAWVADAPPPAPNHYQPMVQAGWVWVSAGGTDDRPVAFIACSVSADGGAVRQLATALEHQQKGHGTALLRTAIAWARRRGLPRLMLATGRNVPWNAPYYRRFGFEDAHAPLPTLERLLADEAAQGYDLATRVAMVLTLTA